MLWRYEGVAKQCKIVRQSVCRAVGPVGRQSVRKSFFFTAEFNWKWHRNHGKLFINKSKKKLRSQMVSGSLSLLYFPLAFHGGRQGSGPDSSEVWGDFPYVRLSVRSPLWAIHA